MFLPINKLPAKSTSQDHADCRHRGRGTAYTPWFRPLLRAKGMPKTHEGAARTGEREGIPSTLSADRLSKLAKGLSCARRQEQGVSKVSED